jgi:hypothetical protein
MRTAKLKWDGTIDRRRREKQKKVFKVKKSKERVGRQGRNKEAGKGGTHQCINK